MCVLVCICHMCLCLPQECVCVCQSWTRAKATVFLLPVTWSKFPPRGISTQQSSSCVLLPLTDLSLQVARVLACSLQDFTLLFSVRLFPDKSQSISRLAPNSLHTLQSAQHQCNSYIWYLVPPDLNAIPSSIWWCLQIFTFLSGISC